MFTRSKISERIGNTSFLVFGQRRIQAAISVARIVEIIQNRCVNNLSVKIGNDIVANSGSS